MFPFRNMTGLAGDFWINITSQRTVAVKQVSDISGAAKSCSLQGSTSIIMPDLFFQKQSDTFSFSKI